MFFKKDGVSSRLIKEPINLRLFFYLTYYLDPNGRYEKKDTLLRFLDHAKKSKLLLRLQ